MCHSCRETYNNLITRCGGSFSKLGEAKELTAQHYQFKAGDKIIRT